ncbi:hypothetical protein IH601_07645 [Candidatus Bipolaricaulota bacterium]|nr:hypothetical protein [Candidatus Bipolaricaulota bacterium]
MFRTLLLLSASYILPLTIEYLLAPMTQAWWIHLVGILISTSFLAWINGYITLSFVDLIPSDEGNQAAEKNP